MASDSSPVLVVTQVDDSTADTVIGQLNKRGVPVVRFDSADFPRQLALAARVGGERGLRGAMRTPSSTVDLAGVRALYYRRPSQFRFDHLDGQDRRFASLQARYGFGGVLANLPGCRYVNHPHAIADAEFKPAQLAAAVELGFTVPDTLITNDLDQSRAFAAAHPEGIVYKPLRHTSYQREGAPHAVWVAPVESGELDESVAGTAHLYQAKVDKAADLRVTVIGDRVFCVRIDSGSQDWRYDYEAHTYRVLAPPPGLDTLLTGFLRRFGLVFGCFDLALRRDGEPVFLECNPNGQWAWLEDATGLPMAAALADLLARGIP